MPKCLFDWMQKCKHIFEKWFVVMQTNLQNNLFV